MCMVCAVHYLYRRGIFKMGLIASNSYLAAFGAGTFIGIASTYFVIKAKYRSLLRKNSHSKDHELDSLRRAHEFENTDDEIRLVLGVRNDLRMQKGKVAAQCGHAAMDAYIKADKKAPELVKSWLQHGGTKIVVRVDNETQLLELSTKAKNLNVLTCIIRDAGHTQVAPGSKTVIAIGPAPKSVLENIAGHLKLY